MLKRKAYQDLVAWKNNSKGRSALLIEGARRVGKTTLVNEFGRNEYRSCLVVDFSHATNLVKSFFDDYALDFDSLFFYLGREYGVRLYDRESLVVFDEVQRFPRARELVKHFVADGRYDYIETGSLISIRENVKDILIPSEETTYALNPMDFEEFLWATGKESSAELVAREFERQHALPQGLHRDMMRLWREYLLVGGMPAAVQSWVDTHELEGPEREKREIIDLYRHDIARFANGLEQRVVRVFDNIPAQLSKHEKRFKLSSLGKSARSSTFENAFFWLDEAKIINPCYRTTDPDVILRMSLDDSAVKCYALDTGLLFTMAFGRGESAFAAQNDVLRGRISINEGMLVENAVAQALRARGEDLLFFSQYDSVNPERRMEIDFLVVRPYANAAGKARVCPIEVKSGTRFSTRSLEKFKAAYEGRVGQQVVLSPRELAVEGDRLYLPLYMAHLV